MISKILVYFPLLCLFCSQARVPRFPRWKEEYDPAAKSGKYEVRVLIKPPLVASPFDVSVGPRGIAVLEVKSGKALGLDKRGRAYVVSENAAGMYFDHDAKGNLYSYSFPCGSIMETGAKGGKARLLARIMEGHSGGSIAVTEDGAGVYVLYLDMKKRISKVYEYSKTKKKGRWLDTSKFFVKGLDSRGNHIYAATDRSVLVLGNGKFHEVVRFREKLWVSPSGFAAFPGKGFFLSYGNGRKSGITFVNRRGKAIRIYETEDVPLDGIDYHEKERKLWFVSKEGGLAGWLRIPRNGFRGRYEAKPRIFRSRNSIATPIAIRVAHNGDIYVNGDEIGVYLIRNMKIPRVVFKRICSYQPPCADFEILPGNRLVYTWAAPGFEPKVVILERKKGPRVLTGKIRLPGGIARLSRREFLVADYGNDRIYKLNLRGGTELFEKGYRFPFGICVAKDRSVYVTCSRKGRKGDPFSVLPLYPEILVRRYPTGKRETIFDLKRKGLGGHLFFAARTPSGMVAFTGSSKVFLYDPGSQEIDVIAENLERPAGIAADNKGNLFVTDYDANALVGIFRK